MKRRVRLLFIWLICLSCANKKKGENSTTSSLPLALADTFDIPKWIAEMPPSQHQLFSSFVKMLNLPPLEGGSKGLQIRIWFSCAPRDTQQTMVFKQVDSIWEARFYTYQINYNEGSCPEFYNVHRESKQPKSGWEYFAGKLLQTQIKDLPDYSFFGFAYNSPTGGDGLAVEVATANKYRQYYYPNLWLNRNLAEGPAKLYKALNLIEKEFNVKSYCQ